LKWKNVTGIGNVIRINIGIGIGIRIGIAFILAFGGIGISRALSGPCCIDIVIS
jgi:hypothetical protein